MTDSSRAALDALSKAAQVLAVGTGESQLHAATEHVATALGASSVSLLALLSDPDHVYLVADSEEVDVGRGATWTTSSMQLSSGSLGSIIAACSTRSRTYLPSSSNRSTIISRAVQPRWLEWNATALSAAGSS